MGQAAAAGAQLLEPRLGDATEGVDLLSDEEPSSSTRAPHQPRALRMGGRCEQRFCVTKHAGPEIHDLVACLCSTTKLADTSAWQVPGRR